MAEAHHSLAADAASAADAAEKVRGILEDGLESGRLFEAMAEVEREGGFSLQRQKDSELAQSCGTRSRGSENVELLVSEAVLGSLLQGVVSSLPDQYAGSQSDWVSVVSATPLPSSRPVSGLDRPETRESGATMFSAATRTTNGVCAEDVIIGLVSAEVAEYAAEQSRPATCQSAMSACTAATQSTNGCHAENLVEELVSVEIETNVLVEQLVTADIKKASTAKKAPRDDVNIDALRKRLGGCMMEAMVSGTMDSHLEAALGASRGASPRRAPPSQAVFSEPEAEALPSSVLAKPPSTGAVALMHALQAISSRDRRVGELHAMIREKERAVAERDLAVATMQEKLAAMNADILHLDLDVEWHKRAQEGATDRCAQLAASQRQLLGDLDFHTMKTQHACIDSDPIMWSSRSDLSTTVGTNFMQTPRRLEPIANR